jgi:sulfhydrogenase subunit beta (sulfur reductase)
MGEQYQLQKEVFADFVHAVMKSHDFIAPVSVDDNKLYSRSTYKKIVSPDQIDLAHNTRFPLKYFFFDKKEILFSYDENKVQDPVLKIKPRVFFGVRYCDLNGVYHQDMVFLDKNPDPFYKKRRDASILIGLHCEEGDKYCFCNSVELKYDFHDLLFFDKGDYYIIEVGSKKGKILLKHKAIEKMLKKVRNKISNEDREIINHKHLKSTDIKDIYKYKDWEQLAETCLSCGACNILCPNCHCFTIKDEPSIDLKSGKRIRVPAACQLRSFTRVAGDHIFRETRVSRYKHRIYHQIVHFKERHGVQFCTGCGRCIRECPTRIDWVKFINKHKKK